MTKQNHLIVFRVDSLGAEGEIALSRCLILAETHMRRGGRVHFALNYREPSVQQLLISRGLDYSIMGAPVGSAGDCQALQACLSMHSCNTVVVAGPRFEATYLEVIAESAYTAVIDVGGKQLRPVQLLINPAFSADERYYTCRADTTLLLGAQFQMLDPNISDWAAPARQKIITKGEASPARIFVTTSDDHATARILEAMPKPSETTILTVLGSRTCPILDAAARSACARGYVVEQIARNTMTDSLIYCDIAIGSVDNSIANLGFLSMPALLFAIDSNDAREAQRLSDEGANMALPPLSDLCESELSAALHEFIRNETRQQAFGRRLGDLVDGLGADRILDCIAQSQTSHLSLLQAA